MPYGTSDIWQPGHSPPRFGTFELLGFGRWFRYRHLGDEGMKRSDPWRRWISREHAAVWNPGGRFGPRRVRVNECWHVLRAEELYTEMLAHDASKIAPGARGTAHLHRRRRKVEAQWEVLQNAVWPLGRVFLRCPRCSGRCTSSLPPAGGLLACLPPVLGPYLRLSHPPELQADAVGRTSVRVDVRNNSARLGTDDNRGSPERTTPTVA